MFFQLELYPNSVHTNEIFVASISDATKFESSLALFVAKYCITC